MPFPAVHQPITVPNHIILGQVRPVMEQIGEEEKMNEAVC